MGLQKADVCKQITGLRPKVKQAIVHLAHHLSRTISKLESKKGGNAEKFRRKAEILRKEIQLLKEINPDSVSKYALMMDFDERDTLLGDIDLSLESKVIIKLATTKPVVSRIENFRAVHPNWRSSVPEFLNELGTKAKRKKNVIEQEDILNTKVEKKSSSSVQLALTNKSKNKNKAVEKRKGDYINGFTVTDFDGGESIVENGSPDENISEDGSGYESLSENGSDVVSENGHEESESGSDVCSEDGDGKLSEDGSDVCSEDSNEDISEDERDSDRSDDDVVHEKSKLRNSLKNRSVPCTPSTSKFAEVRRFADLPLVQGQDSRKLPYSVHESEDENEFSGNESVEEDTFFMTGENKFLKTAAVKRSDGEGVMLFKKHLEDMKNVSSSRWAEDGKKCSGNRAQRRAKVLGRDRVADEHRNNKTAANVNLHKNEDSFIKFSSKADQEPRKKVPERQTFLDKKSNNTLGKRSDNGSRKDSFRGKDKISSSTKVHSQTRQLDPVADEKLHPSWEAKRKQKISLGGFQGKKIKFDDE